MAEECAAAADAGADAVHVYAKDLHGEDSLASDDVARWVIAVRQACPGIPVGVTTGAWSLPDPTARAQAVRNWTTLPDFASVNWHKEGADDVAAALLARGVGVEAGIWNVDGLQAWPGLRLAAGNAELIHAASSRRTDRVTLTGPESRAVNDSKIRLRTGW